MSYVTAGHHRLREGLKAFYLAARGAALKLWPQAQTKPIPGNPASVLVISQRRLGDIALEIPALRDLRERFPQAGLGVVAPVEFHDLFRASCRPEQLLASPGGWADLFRTARILRQDSWDVAIDLTTDYHLAPAFLALLSGARVCIGFGHTGRGRFFHQPLAIPAAAHMMDLFYAPMKPFGIRPPKNLRRWSIVHPPLPLPESKPGQRQIGIHPGATHWTQRWPVSSYASLARTLMENGENCILLGSKADEPLLVEIQALMAGHAPRVMAGGSTLSLAATLAKLDLLICNNSGPLHLAGLVGVPTLSFMGPTVKDRWWPRGAVPGVVLRRDDLPCIGCNRGYCRIGTHACLREISPAQAFAAYKKLLDSIERGPDALE